MPTYLLAHICKWASGRNVQSWCPPFMSPCLLLEQLVAQITKYLAVLAVGVTHLFWVHARTDGVVNKEGLVLIYFNHFINFLPIHCILLIRNDTHLIWVSAYLSDQLVCGRKTYRDQSSLLPYTNPTPLRFIGLMDEAGYDAHLFLDLTYCGSG